MKWTKSDYLSLMDFCNQAQLRASRATVQIDRVYVGWTNSRLKGRYHQIRGYDTRVHSVQFVQTQVINAINQCEGYDVRRAWIVLRERWARTALGVSEDVVEHILTFL